MTDGAALRTDDIGTVEDRFFTIREFPLANGTVMPEATIAYETYGRLASHGQNAVLITHGLPAATIWPGVTRRTAISRAHGTG